jgi:NADH dehydrogenase FAD-containing subunit
MSARVVNGNIYSVTNCRGETIEVGYIVTVIEEEHIYGTGEVKEIRSDVGRPHFAMVAWEDGDTLWSYLHVDELTNINLAARDSTLNDRSPRR